MIDFKNILLTTDLSENARAALPYAAGLAKKYHGTLHLLHVFEESAYYGNAAAVESVPFGMAEWLERTKTEHKKDLKARAAAIQAETGVKTIPEMRVGTAVHEIIAHAKESKADCIVIATHGHTGMAHFIFGSVAEKIVRLSPCPVLTVRPPEKT